MQHVYVNGNDWQVSNGCQFISDAAKLQSKTSQCSLSTFEKHRNTVDVPFLTDRGAITEKLLQLKRLQRANVYCILHKSMFSDRKKLNWRKTYRLTVRISNCMILTENRAPTSVYERHHQARETLTIWFPTDDSRRQMDPFLTRHLSPVKSWNMFKNSLSHDNNSAY